ncbi:MAG: quercetin 2,3-dioxygenase [Proteobacteria bacterium ST_bin12]|nr:MAG: quercetin 2,3-dioxygenase [Proteobacteria bacterium ST_bin12]
MQIRQSSERGHANRGWLDSYHSFSFADYYDPNWMGFSVLRVVNEDVIAPAKGFGTHSHNDMEIITYILKGELAHKDSMGNVETIKQGYVQRMTAGTGVSHSEFNASSTEPVHLLQIWITPNQLHLTPGYEDKFFDPALKLNQWCLLASQSGVQNSLIVHQDIALYAAQLTDKHALNYTLKQNRKAYVQIALGNVEVNGRRLMAGDAAMFDGNEVIEIKAHNSAEVLLFDLP